MAFARFNHFFRNNGIWGGWKGAEQTVGGQQKMKMTSQAQVLRKIPGPEATGEYGAIPEIQSLGGFSHPFVLSKNLRQKYGPIVRVEFPPERDLQTGEVLQEKLAVWLYDHREFEKVFESEGPLPIGGANFVEPFAVYWAGRQNVAFVNDENWLWLRRLLQKDFLPPQAAESYVAGMASVVERASALFPQYRQQMGDFIPRLTFELMGTVLFGRSLGLLDEATADPEDVQYCNDVKLCFELAQVLQNLPRSMWSADMWNQMTAALDRTMERGAHHMKLTFSDTRAAASQAYLSKLMSRDRDSAQMSEQTLAINITGLLFGGVDTTSSAIQFLLRNLALNPDVQEEVAESVASHLQGRSLQLGDVANLPYLKAAVKESFRLTPTTSGTVRLLPVPVELCGYQIPPFTPIMINPIPDLHDEEYFDNPLQFAPKRWLERSEKLPMHNPYLVMPFSRGKRMCMGARVAEFEIYSIFSRLLQDYRFSIDGDDPSHAIEKLIIRPEPSPAYIFTPRH